MLSPTESRELVEKHGGNQSAAAREVGVAVSTFQRWLDPERKRAKDREWYVRNREAKKAYARELFANLTGPEYNRRLLQMRRAHAMKRKRKREQRRAEEAI